jgi:predicted acetyltransferase
MNELSDGEIFLRLERETPGDPSRQWLPACHYEIVLESTGQVVGKIDLRIGYTTSLVRYGGHIGYQVFEQHRGNHYAGKACRLLKKVAKQHGMDVIWITCNPDNWPSRKTCEWIGAQLVEIVDLSPDNDQYQRGDRQKCRYRVVVY